MKKQLLFLLGLGILLILGLVLLWNFSPQLLPKPVRPTIKWSGMAPPISLADAGARAGARAREWADDIVLIKLKASWRPSPDWLQTDYPPVAWSFYYYSPGAHAVASVAVHGETLFWVPPFEMESKSAALSPFPPPHGVDVAWLSFRAAGGEDLLRQNPDTLVQFQLRQQEGRPIWTIVAYGTDIAYTVVVDGQSGRVLSAE